MSPRERPDGHRCPHCGERVTRLPDHRSRYTCPRCRTRYLVLADAETRAAAFVDESDRPVTPPLRLPPGSVRALVALAMTATCAAMVAADRRVPGSLASLLLAIVGFYFGFRTKAAGLSDTVYDPAARREQPLRLPAGVIRWLLMATFVVMGALLWRRGELLGALEYVEFFFIIAGLIVGHAASKAFAGTDPAVKAAAGHVAAVVVLLVAAALAWLFASGSYADTSPYAVIGLCAAVSVYYGSRT